MINVTQVVEAMEQEGCGGCAEDFLCAVRDGDAPKAVAVAHESVQHIVTESYGDGMTENALNVIRTWIAEVTTAEVSS